MLLRQEHLLLLLTYGGAPKMPLHCHADSDQPRLRATALIRDLHLELCADTEKEPLVVNDKEADGIFRHMNNFCWAWVHMRDELFFNPAQIDIAQRQFFFWICAGKIAVQKLLQVSLC